MKKKLLTAVAAALAFQVHAQTQTYTPITLAGYTADVIANGSGSAMNSTNNGADGSDFAFVAQNFVNPSGQSPAANSALPNNGLITSTITTTPGLTFQLAPYTGNNSLRIASAASGTITFSTPNSATELYVLVTPVAYVGTIPVTITVNFTDGTNQVFTGISFNNWYGGANPAWSGSSRVNRTTNVIDVQTQGPRIFQQKLTLNAVNTSKPIQSILFNNNSGGSSGNILNVLAVSATAGVSTLATDAGITAVSAPNSGCVLTNQETITVIVKNHGTTPQSNIPVSYKINNGTPVNEVVAGPVPANSSVNYSFTTKANLSTLGTYTLEVRTTLTGDLNAANDILSRTVTLATPPAAPVISLSGTSTFCNSGSVTLTATSATPGATFLWFNNGVAIANATSASYTANAAGNYTVTAAASGCSGPASAATILTTGSNPGVPTISASGPLAICTGGSVNLTAVVLNPNVTLTWFKNGTVISGATTSTYTATTAGNYTVTATQNGCSSPGSAASVVTIKATPPTPAVTKSGAVLTSSSTTGNQWYKNGVLIPGATTVTYTATSNGSYTVVVTSNGCSSLPSNAVNFSTTGVGEDMAVLNVKVFPNPANGLFNIELPKGKAFELEITDLSGKVIMQKQVNGETRLNLKEAAKGIYLLKVSSENGMAVRKLILE